MTPARAVVRQLREGLSVEAHCGCGDPRMGCAQYTLTIDVPMWEAIIDAALRERERATVTLAESVLYFHEQFKLVATQADDPSKELIEEQMRRHALMLRLATASLAAKGEA